MIDSSLVQALTESLVLIACACVGIFSPNYVEFYVILKIMPYCVVNACAYNVSTRLSVRAGRLDSVITISIVKGSHAVMFRLVHYHIWSYFILRRGSNEYI